MSCLRPCFTWGTPWTVPRVAPVPIKPKALAPKVIVETFSPSSPYLTHDPALAKEKNTSAVAAVRTLGLRSELSTLPDNGRGCVQIELVCPLGLAHHLGGIP